MKSVIAFEAAARHLSLTRASEELCVVPAAISHHIRLLENWLGVPMFRHENKGLALTDAGRAYMHDLGPIFDAVAEATNAVQSNTRNDRLTVTAPPSFTTKWLLPRLHEFRKLHPDIDMDLAVSAALTDCMHETVDVGIHYSRGEYPDLYSVRLVEVELFPVCRPMELYNGRKPPTQLADLADHTLLHDDMLRVNERKDWRYWLQSAGANDLTVADQGLHFNQAAMAYQAAIDGHGIALAKSVLVELDLVNGRLLRPFSHSCKTGYYYCLVCRPSKKDTPKVVAFREWVVEEVQTTAGNLQPTDLDASPS